MSEISNSEYRTPINEIDSQWGFRIVGMDDVRKKGITGKGIKISVIDPHPSPAQKPLYFWDRSYEDNRGVHGFGIAS